ncbi:helix-turn-helix domain-containing protein [Pirellulaceae bacterium SH449]
MKKSQKKIDETLADTIRNAINASELTLYRIAKDSGVSVPSITRFVNEERTISLETADKLCKCLGLELVERVEE